MNRRNCGIALLAMILIVGWSTVNGATAIEITVSAGRYSRTNAPVRAILEVPEAHSGAKVATLIGEQGPNLVGQLTAPSLLSTGNHPASRELHFVLPALPANQSGRTLSTTCHRESRWN